VYLIFDRDEHLIYVGVAGWLDKRIWSHDQQPEFVSRPRRWTDVILFDQSCAFLAPALEEFLIARLEPAHNLKRR
jgi:excinuclease UvrABC nuclease subunit